MASGEPVLVAVPTPNLERLRGSLERDGDVMRFEDMTIRGRNPSCILSMYQEWIDTHPGRVRVVGEPIWPGRSHAGVIECVRHEALVNVAFADADAEFLCPYDAEGLEADALLGAEMTHPTVIDGDGSRVNSSRYAEPLEVHNAARWPLEPSTGVVAEHAFAGDLQGLRQFVASDDRVASLDRGRITDFVFSINEAATNAVRHGDGHCLVRIWRDEEQVISEVSSVGGFQDVLVGRLRPGIDATSGRGLWLVNQLCDLVELRCAESVTTLRMHVRSSPARGCRQ